MKSYPAIAESVAAIRATVAQFARTLGASREAAHDVALAVSEAATNVVVHAYRDSVHAGRIELSGALAADELVVTVSDAGAGLRGRSDSPGLGLGLAIIARAADRIDLLDSAAGGVEVRMYFALGSMRG